MWISINTISWIAIAVGRLVIGVDRSIVIEVDRMITRLVDGLILIGVDRLIDRIGKLVGLIFIIRWQIVIVIIRWQIVTVTIRSTSIRWTFIR